MTEPRNSTGDPALDAFLDYGLYCADAAAYSVRSEHARAWDAAQKSYEALDRFLRLLDRGKPTD